MDPVFRNVWTLQLAGPTCSGKTQWTKKLLKYIDEMTDVPVQNVFWCYGIATSDLAEIEQHPKVKLIEGPPSMEMLQEYKHQRNLVIIDDLMGELKNSSVLNDFFTKGAHHLNTCVLNITQNLFASKDRTARINTSYIVLTKSPADKLQIQVLARQLYPENKKFLIDAYTDAVSRPFGYLVIDCSPFNMDDERRILTNIFPDEGDTIVYVPR
uniref:ATPase_AAA_core domain-containing protein n=1 Tax=Steinernema glaseri TaxID=37863 RepID=A0A1I7YW71_9BILA